MLNSRAERVVKAPADITVEIADWLFVVNQVKPVVGLDCVKLVTVPPPPLAALNVIF